MRALDDKEIVKKLPFTLKQQLPRCQKSAILLDAMGLSDPKSINAVKQQGKQHHHGHKQSNGNQHQCGNCMKSHPPECPAKDSPCNKCGNIGHWKSRCYGGELKKHHQLNKRWKKQNRRGPLKKVDDVGTDLDHPFDDIDVASISQQKHHHQE